MGVVLKNNNREIPMFYDDGTPTSGNAFREVPVRDIAICFMEWDRTELCCIHFPKPSADNIFLCGGRGLGGDFS